VQPVARGDVDRRLQLVFEELLDADQMKRVEATFGIVVDEQVQVAARGPASLRAVEPNK
jgi:hypothetical protein